MSDWIKSAVERGKVEAKAAREDNARREREAAERASDAAIALDEFLKLTARPLLEEVMGAFPGVLTMTLDRELRNEYEASRPPAIGILIEARHTGAEFGIFCSRDACNVTVVGAIQRSPVIKDTVKRAEATPSKLREYAAAWVQLAAKRGVLAA